MSATRIFRLSRTIIVVAFLFLAVFMMPGATKSQASVSTAFSSAVVAKGGGISWVAGPATGMRTGAGIYQGQSRTLWPNVRLEQTRLRRSAGILSISACQVKGPGTRERTQCLIRVPGTSKSYDIRSALASCHRIIRGGPSGQTLPCVINGHGFRGITGRWYATRVQSQIGSSPLITQWSPAQFVGS